MRYLLDTHSFLWFINGDNQLSGKAKKAILDADKVKYISIASLWEIAIKVNIGKLKIDMPFEDLMQKHIVANSFEILPITFEHTHELSKLDLHHRDPFDRIIIAQAISEMFTVITIDSIFQNYKPLKVLW